MVDSKHPSSQEQRVVSVIILLLGGYFLMFDYPKLDARQFACALLLQGVVAVLTIKLADRASLKLWLTVASVLAVGLIGSAIEVNKVSLYASTHLVLAIALFNLSLAAKAGDRLLAQSMSEVNRWRRQ